MTTEAPTKTVQTPAQEMAQITANLKQAQDQLDATTKAFQELMATAGKGKSLEEQLGISQALQDAQSRVGKLTSSLESATKRAKVAQLEAPTAKLREALKSALGSDTNVFSSVDVTGIRFIASIKSNEDGSSAWEVSSSFMGANAPVVSGGGSTGGARGANRYVVEGVQYATREYVEKFAPDAIASGKVAWTGNPTDSVGLSHRADVLAEKLGHEKVKVTSE